MKLFIPPVGTRIELTSDWSFALYHEYRNESLIKQIDPDCNVKFCEYVSRHSSELASIKTSLPAGTKLEINRVYIRSNNKAKTGADNYDSISFKVVKSDKKSPPIRFWVKLTDANQIDYRFPDDSAATIETAIERKIKPQKLTATTIRNKLNAHFYRTDVHYPYPTVTWVKQDLDKKMQAMYDEHHKRQSSFLGVFKSYNRHPNHYLFICDQLLSSCSVVKHQKLSDGRRLRKFTPTQYDYNKQNIDDFWFSVITDAEDMNILETDCGYTPR